MNRRCEKAAIAAVMAAALLFFVGTPRAGADDDNRGKCQHAVEKAEARLDRSIQRNGEHSRETDERRRYLNEERERCWNQYHQWWNARDHRWETEHNWDQDHRDRDHDHDSDHRDNDQH